MAIANINKQIGPHQHTGLEYQRCTISLAFLEKNNKNFWTHSISELWKLRMAFCFTNS